MSFVSKVVALIAHFKDAMVQQSVVEVKVSRDRRKDMANYPVYYLGNSPISISSLPQKQRWHGTDMLHLHIPLAPSDAPGYGISNLLKICKYKLSCGVTISPVS